PAPMAGTWTFTVTGFNVPIGPQPYALVITRGVPQDPDFSVDATPASVPACAASGASWNVNVGSILGYSGTVSLASSGHPAGSTPVFTPTSVSAPGASTLDLGTAGIAGSGDYAFNIEGDDGVNTHAAGVTLLYDAAAGAAPALSTPADGASDVPVQPTLTWSAAAGARSYTVEVDDDPAFGSIDYSATVTGTSHSLGSSLEAGTHYFWRVR